MPDDDPQEKRREPRKLFSKPVLISLNYNLRGRGFFVNVSPSGLLLRSDELFKQFKQQRLELLLDHEIKILLPPLTIKGRLVRLSPTDHLMAVRLETISDQANWLKICRESDED